MRFGFHISIAGGFSKVVEKASARGCETLQFFSRNPRGWKYELLPGRKMYLGYTAIHRVMIDGKRIARVMLREYLSGNNHTLSADYKDDYMIALLYNSFGRPDEWKDEYVRAVWAKCKARRSWMTNLSALNPSEVAPISYWLEIESNVFFFDYLSEYPS